jgi:uncharacterized protein (DUF3084 family)
MANANMGEKCTHLRVDWVLKPEGLDGFVGLWRCGACGEGFVPETALDEAKSNAQIAECELAHLKDEKFDLMTANFGIAAERDALSREKKELMIEHLDLHAKRDRLRSELEKLGKEKADCVALNFGLVLERDAARKRSEAVAKHATTRHAELEEQVAAEHLAGNTYKESCVRHSLVEVEILLDVLSGR